jgi:hypothetical protein
MEDSGQHQAIPEGGHFDKRFGQLVASVQRSHRMLIAQG